MTDIALQIIDGAINIDIANGDLVADEGLETAVFLSLFVDQRVARAELPAGEVSQRGWWGDLYSEVVGDKIGSKLWLIDRSKRLPATEAEAEARCNQALKWMVDDGVAKKVSTVAGFDTEGRLQIEIQITRPDGGKDKFSVAWEKQALKRA